jgi:HD superfamily phosphohydrolase
MYKTVYWHKTVRIATAMIKKAVLLALEKGSIKKEELYGIDDNQFASLFAGLGKNLTGLVEAVTNRNLYKVASEIDYNEKDLTHQELTDLDTRRELEAKITKKIEEMTGETVPDTSVIIDIPEPISFEVDLPISMPCGFTPFPEAESVFSSPMVAGFSESLRKVRLITPRHLLEKIPAEKTGSLLP